MTKQTPALTLSFEFFPPKTTEGTTKLHEAIQALSVCEPHFVSVTYGAGGSTLDTTQETLLYIKNTTHLNTAAHLTCVGASKQEIEDLAREYWQKGIRHIVALRGDARHNLSTYQDHHSHYDYAYQLVKTLREIAPFEISVAAYPEKHPEAPSLEQDIEYLKLKLDLGATRAITQFFFHPNTFFAFIEKAQKKGITQPIIPGILPIYNFKNMVNFAQKCQAHIPPPYFEKFAQTPPADHEKLSLELCVDLCTHLISQGFHHLHFYTLNQSELVLKTLNMLGYNITQPEHKSRLCAS